MDLNSILYEKEVRRPVDDANVFDPGLLREKKGCCLVSYGDTRNWKRKRSLYMSDIHL